MEEYDLIRESETLDLTGFLMPCFNAPGIDQAKKFRNTTPT